uniref:HicB_like antitoxin of toxin-antitoxin system n=2 Tax=Candidatus Kentrum sp. SD TaxID=2126332 RepID=A0A451BNC7_9GAMM|nr:MAG: HicB_like antitoxin of toxin-antitoxin system [Candidatus Kentron sp. SD]
MPWFPTFIVIPEQDEDGAWVSECPSIPGCVSQGKTRTDAIANIREAIRLCLGARQLRLSWNAIDGIMQRAVKRGMARRANLRNRSRFVLQTETPWVTDRRIIVM